MLTEKQFIFLGVVVIILFVYGLVVRVIFQDSEQRKALLQPRKKDYMDGNPKEMAPLV